MDLNNNNLDSDYSIAQLSDSLPHWTEQEKLVWLQIKQHLIGETSSSGIALLKTTDGQQLRRISESLLRVSHAQGLAMPLKVHYHNQLEKIVGSQVCYEKSGVPMV